MRRRAEERDLEWLHGDAADSETGPAATALDDEGDADRQDRTRRAVGVAVLVGCLVAALGVWMLADVFIVGDVGYGLLEFLLTAAMVPLLVLGLVALLAWLRSGS